MEIQATSGIHGAVSLPGRLFACKTQLNCLRGTPVDTPGHNIDQLMNEKTTVKGHTFTNV